MALIKCRECEKEYSDQASACPSCGCPTGTNLYFPFASETEKTRYDKYVELLQQDSPVYNWKVCRDCGKKQELNVDIFYDKPNLEERINNHNAEMTCIECGSSNLYLTPNMPFPQIAWFTNSIEYNALYLTFPYATPAGQLTLNGHKNEKAIRSLPVLHPYYVRQDWENNLPEEVKKKIKYYTPNRTPSVIYSNKNTVTCPNCGSTQIQMVQRKWSFLTGFMTNKVDRVCVKCKHRF